jgi:magnesium-transporting ATPase (P-type)
VLETKDGEIKSFKVLAKFSFTSDRKRMSIVVSSDDFPGCAVVLTKGADVAIYDILHKIANTKNMEESKRYLDEFSCSGLRTLCLSVGVYDIQFFKEWQLRFDEVHNKMKEFGGTEDEMLIAHKEIISR